MMTWLARRLARSRPFPAALLLVAGAAACDAAPSADATPGSGAPPGQPALAGSPAPANAPAAVAGLDPAGGAAPPADTVDLRKLGYARGSESAPVVVYEFSDFGCPFCGSFARGTYPELHREFVATGKVRWVYVPFVMGMFPNGEEAARASECAAEQDRFWPMHDLLFEQQNEWKNGRRPAALFAGYATRLGLDGARFASCYREDRGGARTRANNRAADAVGIRATPSFLINGRVVEGALPLEQFRQVLTMLSGS